MSKKSSRRRAASKKPAAPAQPARTGPKVSTLTYVVAALGGALVYLLLYCWTAKIALFIAPVVAGAFVAFVLGTEVSSAFVGAIAGMIGSAIGATVSTSATFVAIMQQAPTRWPDVTSAVYTIADGLVSANPVNTLGAGVVVVAGTLGTAACAWAVAAVLGRIREQHRGLTTRVLSTAIVVLVCASFVYTAVSTTSNYGSETVSKERQPGSYAYDAVVYAQTYYNMLKGQDFYDALLNAGAGDSRVAVDKSIQNGRVASGGWLWGPAAIRRPTIFYIWKYLAPGGGAAVIGLGIWLAALVLGLSYWALIPYLGKRAIIGPVVLMPYFLWMSFGYNPFFPDYWGGLFALAALLLILRKQWIAGAAVMFLAAVTRETMGPVLGVLAIVLGVIWLRDRKAREWLVRGAVFAALAVAWLVLERVHEAAGAPHFAFAYTSSVQMLINLAGARTFVQKAILPTDYLAYAYGFFKVYGLVWLLLAPLGFWAVLKPEREVRWALLAFVGFWIVFLFVMGATSSYWGQTIMPPMLLGSALLLVGADRLDRTLQLRAPIE
jgi:hypothetical protein